MTTPRWIKSAYAKGILAILLILGVIATCVCLNSYDVFNSSALSSQDKERQEFSKTNSLKTLVEAWLKGEWIPLCRQLYSLNLSLNLLMKLMSWETERFDIDFFDAATKSKNWNFNFTWGLNLTLHQLNLIFNLLWIDKNLNLICY